MAITINELETSIKQAFPEAQIIIEDLAGDGDHYAIEITAEDFRNKSLIEQHKMVNSALKHCLGTSLHALKIKTKTPS